MEFRHDVINGRIVKPLPCRDWAGTVVTDLIRQGTHGLADQKKMIDRSAIMRCLNGPFQVGMKVRGLFPELKHVTQNHDPSAIGGHLWKGCQ